MVESERSQYPAHPGSQTLYFYAANAFGGYTSSGGVEELSCRSVLTTPVTAA